MPGLFRRWVLATWAGWVLGIPCIVGLALIGESVGIGGSQVIVGVGAGIGIGLAQGRVIRGVLGRWGPWLASCAVGLGLPFLVADLARWAEWQLAYSLPAYVAAGGLLVGSWQALLLRRRFGAAGWWVPASLLGWSLAGATAFVAEALPRTPSLRGLTGAGAYLGIVAAGGLLLGLVTGAALAWLQHAERPR